MELFEIGELSLALVTGVFLIILGLYGSKKANEYLKGDE